MLDLGCGSGVPLARVLVEEGCRVWGVDASPAMLAAFRVNLPGAEAACEPAERTRHFGRTFDAVLAWGLIFLLEPAGQAALVGRAADALRPGGSFLFTAPAQVHSWTDILTGRESLALGRGPYNRLLQEAGLTIEREYDDGWDNHYYLARR